MTVGTVGNIGSLDPRTGNSVVAREVWKIQYPTLTAVDPRTLDPTAGVAIAWSPLPNGNGWRYELRPKLTWSDGKPVTAADVVYSLEHARDEQWPYANGMLDGLSARARRRPHRCSDVAVEDARIFPASCCTSFPRMCSRNTPTSATTPLPSAWATGRGTSCRSRPTRSSSACWAAPAVRRSTRSSSAPTRTTDALIDALARGDVDVIGDVSDSEVDRLHALDDVTVNPGPDAGESHTVEAFRTDNVTGFLPEPARPRLVVFGPTVAQYAGIVAAHRPPGEKLSNATYAIGAAVLLALTAAGYCIVARVRRRYVT